MGIISSEIVKEQWNLLFNGALNVTLTVRGAEELVCYVIMVPNFVPTRIVFSEKRIPTYIAIDCALIITLLYSI